MTLLRTSLLAVAVSASLFAGTAAAGTANTQFQVSIIVENNCTVSVNPLVFPNSNTLAAAVDGATTGSITCSGTSPVTVSFNEGDVAGSTLATRLLSNGTDTVTYDLYRDAGRTELLGDGTTGGTVTIARTGTSTFDVYGRVDGSQNPKPAGTYLANVTATVTF